MGQREEVLLCTNVKSLIISCLTQVFKGKLDQHLNSRWKRTGKLLVAEVQKLLVSGGRNSVAVTFKFDLWFVIYYKCWQNKQDAWLYTNNWHSLLLVSPLSLPTTTNGELSTMTNVSPLKRNGKRLPTKLRLSKLPSSITSCLSYRRRRSILSLTNFSTLTSLRCATWPSQWKLASTEPAELTPLSSIWTGPQSNKMVSEPGPPPTPTGLSSKSSCPPLDHSWVEWAVAVVANNRLPHPFRKRPRSKKSLPKKLISTLNWLLLTLQQRLKWLRRCVVFLALDSRKLRRWLKAYHNGSAKKCQRNKQKKLSKN